VLLPGEVGEVEVILDTSRFVGPKTQTLFLTLDNGTVAEARLTITADSQESSMAEWLRSPWQALWKGLKP
jgi:hypothetical protein